MESIEARPLPIPYSDVRLYHSSIVGPRGPGAEGAVDAVHLGVDATRPLFSFVRPFTREAFAPITAD
jgi:hypothetical protein